MFVNVDCTVYQYTKYDCAPKPPTLVRLDGPLESFPRGESTKSDESPGKTQYLPVCPGVSMHIQSYGTLM